MNNINPHPAAGKKINELVMLTRMKYRLPFPERLPGTINQMAF
jgi:hypothetical protein